jgi:microcystin-dependent protein
MSFSFVPAGTILPFGGSSAPKGWLLCNGASVTRSKYAALFAAIGTNWGSADGSHFNVPDLQGKFIRGAITGSREVGTHQDQATATNGLGGSADISHDHGAHGHSDSGHQHRIPVQTYVASGSGGGGSVAIDGIGYWAPFTAEVGAANISSTGVSLGATSKSLSLNGDAETRPSNYGVHYIIKI